MLIATAHLVHLSAAYIVNAYCHTTFSTFVRRIPSMLFAAAHLVHLSGVYQILEKFRLEMFDVVMVRVRQVWFG